MPTASRKKKSLGRRKRKVGFVKPHPTASHFAKALVEEESQSGEMNKKQILKWLRDVKKQGKLPTVVTGLKGIHQSFKTPGLLKVVLASTTGTQNTNIHLPSLCHYYSIPLVFCQQFADQISVLAPKSTGVGETCVGVTSDVPQAILNLQYKTPSYLRPNDTPVEKAPEEAKK
eukprot:TRINITY_DN12058_c0_g1_i1.p1 TRINITY_DN12058_c0_g1~~TRINITY_DN12058_c0_g1_i1.p1  ORF type:complete len:173 (+),score=19.92 TRINITY_DN12058_c0_g1_i1:85-603(+)